MSNQTFTISSESDGLTVTEYARQQLHISAREWQGLVRSKNIRVNNRQAHSKKVLHAGDTVIIYRKSDTQLTISPEKKSLEILYEDTSCLIINKAPFLLVHPTSSTHSGTLSNYIADYYQTNGLHIPVRPVHRLDRDTSGCILIAKSKEAQQYYTEQLSNNTLHRTYRLLVTGSMQGIPSPIEYPIGIDASSPNRRIVTDHGKPATTFFTVLEEYADSALNNSTVSLIEATIPTGRTHQIRVHFSHVGHPLIGDAMYGTRNAPYTRQCLHAYKLSFIPYQQQQAIDVIAPLPLHFGKEI